jgi:hypothetical protein
MTKLWSSSALKVVLSRTRSDSSHPLGGADARARARMSSMSIDSAGAARLGVMHPPICLRMRSSARHGSTRS